MWLTVLLAVLLLWPGAAAVAAPAGNGRAPVVAAEAPATSDGAEAVLVQLAPGGDAAALPAVPGAGQPAATGAPGLYRVAVPGGDIAPVVAALSQAPGVAYAEADGQMHAAQVEPDDPRWDEQWAKTKIGAPEAWEVTTGSSAVTVAVLDTGVADHPELEGRLLSGWDAVDETTDTSDVGVASHGTAVTGILAARGDNGVGIAGMCWECLVLPVRVLDKDGNGRFVDIVEGIRWAVDNGADIINMSFGSMDESQAVEDAVRYAADNGVSLVGSAGNYNSVGETWPAAMPQVIGVAASTETDARFSWSSHGPWADVAAPGCGVGLNKFGGVSNEVCGTSFGTPLVSGILALLLANEPASTPAQLQAALFDAAVDVGTWVAQGRVDAAGALTDPMPSPSPSPTPSPTPTPSTACSPDEVPPAGFPDVAGNVHRAAIDCAAWYGIAEGLADGTYGPAVSVRRDQMASMLARMLVAEGVTLPAGTTSTFSDTSGNVHRTAINQLAQLDVVRGRTATTFAPAEPVRRDQMASFVARAHRVATGNALPAGGAQFNDIAGNVHRTNIEALAAAGVVAGVGFGRYAPAAAVRRDQLATFTTSHLELLAAEGHALKR